MGWIFPERSVSVDKLKPVILIMILAIGGYVGYRMYQGESLSDITSELGEVVITPYLKAERCVNTADWNDAANYYKDAIESHNNPEASDKLRLSENQIQHCHKQIAFCYYKVGYSRGWTKQRQSQAIKAYKDYMKKYELSKEDERRIKDRISQIRAKGGGL